MMGHWPRVTRKDLVQAVAAYARAFPGWEHIRRSHLRRTQGPVMQQIGFQILRSGPYRVTAAIKTMTEPTFQMLAEILRLKSHQDTMRDFETKWPGVVAAMEQQFRPSVLAPLDLHEVRALCERKALDKVNDHCFPAILDVHLGNTGRAISRCERALAVPPWIAGPRPDWELEKMEFARQLQVAIETGKEQRFLDGASATLSSARPRHEGGRPLRRRRRVLASGGMITGMVALAWVADAFGVAGAALSAATYAGLV